MEILKFIKWWWKTLSTDNKAVIYTTLVILLGVALVIFAGAMVTFLVLLALGVCFFLWIVLVEFYKVTKCRWKRFKEIQEYERDEIVRKLKGNM